MAADQSVDAPSLETLARIARDFNLRLSHADLEAYQALMAGPLASYQRIAELTPPAPALCYPRDAGAPPADNPLGAWYWRGELQGAADGLLAGKRLAIKDNACVAGWPMMNGSRVLEGHVPEVDASVVTRVLDAGGRILGKSVCENLCFSGGSHTSATGPVRNPHDPTRSTGGSSSGSAALVAAGEVDMAIAGDQGGSIRMPAGWCGIYGLKPSWGLVPYTGIFPIEQTIDHVGPLAATTKDVALLLQAIAGPDGGDPRQNQGLQNQDYVSALSGDAAGLKIGIVGEGFGLEGAEPDVDEAVRAAALRFADIGATVADVSVPWHADGMHIWNGIGIEGATELMLKGNGMGSNWKGVYNVGLLEAMAAGRRERADEFSETVKLVLLLGAYVHEAGHGRVYAQAQNLARTLTAEYDRALGEYDLLAMPTQPMKATPLPPADAPREVIVARALEMVANTAPFNISGHPAMSLPCAVSEGLPVGLMLIGRHGDEATILRAADAFERGVFARPLPPKPAAAA